MMVCLNMNNFFVNDIDKILVDIYVIGYESQGESIYIRIKTLDNQYVKDILIDCYATQYNKTLELLENLKGNENQIDYICVSHYHDDHIKEIDKIINKYSKKNTTILIPDVDREDSLTEMAKNVRNCIADRRINGRKIWGHIKKISEPQQNIFFEELEYNDKKISIEISLKNWYKDYMQKNINANGTKIGLDDVAYTIKPVHESNFKYSYKMDIENEPQNIIEEIRSIVNNLINVFSRIKAGESISINIQ